MKVYEQRPVTGENICFVRRQTDFGGLGTLSENFQTVGYSKFLINYSLRLLFI